MRAIRFTIEDGERRGDPVELDLAREDALKDRSVYVTSVDWLPVLRANLDSGGLVEIEFKDVGTDAKRAGRKRSICRQEAVPFYFDDYGSTGTVANGVIKALGGVCTPVREDGKGGKPGLQTFIVAIEDELFRELERIWAPDRKKVGGVFAASDPRFEERARNLLGYLDPVTGAEEAAARERFLGASAACDLVRRKAILSAKRDANTLITGETGTGKGVIAEFIHHQSQRRGAFITCNCAAISPELFEVLFFGNVKDFPNPGTPATDGYFREADGGTLFLDEVGDLIPSHQAKLLRVIEKGAVKPLGANEEIPVDVRILSATDRDLLGDASGKNPRFREQLYERLRKLSIHAPPLRSHLQDVSELALAYWAKIPESGGKELTPNTLRMLGLHSWPRNVRELEGFLMHLAVYINQFSMEKVVREYLVRGVVDDLGTSGDAGHQHVDLDAMIDVLAKASHETWLEAERKLNCRWGPKRIDDGEVRTSPHFEEFDKLDDEMKSKSRNEASAILQALLEHGFVIRKVDLDG